MATKKTEIKELREAALAHLEGKVSTREKLYAALPTLAELQSSVNNARKNLRASEDALRELSAACADYAKAHPSCLDEQEFDEQPGGVQTGDITIDDTTYHISCGFDGYVRADGQKLTQEFLNGLPKGWTKTKTGLNTSSINRINPSDEELLENGLCHKANDVWSVRE